MKITQYIVVLAALMLGFNVPVFAQDTSNPKEKIDPSVVRTLTSKTYRGYMPDNRGQGNYTWTLNLDTIQDGKVNGKMTLYYPRCNGNLPITGTLSEMRLDLVAGSTIMCDGRSMYLLIEKGGDILSGEMNRPDGVIKIILK